MDKDGGILIAEQKANVPLNIAGVQVIITGMVKWERRTKKMGTQTVNY